MKKRKLKISPKALADIQNAVDYYNEQQKGLGKRFADYTYKTIRKIEKMPQAASLSHKDVRYKVMPDFPFIITYRFNDTTIDIARVFNTALNPDSLT